MKFGETSLIDSKGAILAHSIRVGGKTFKKGITLHEPELAFLQKNGIERIVTAKLEQNDLHENDAALRLAKALKTEHLEIGQPGTGRCNLIAAANGLIKINKKLINTLNRNDEAITVATVSPGQALKKGDIAATVKIITFGVSLKYIIKCEQQIKEKKPLHLDPFKRLRIGLVQTTLSNTKNSVISKAHNITADRITALGSEFAQDYICKHEKKEIIQAIKIMKSQEIDILLILGASAISDRRDIVPQAIKDTGGNIIHFGMPVDPGNLMLLGKYTNMKILGIPGSARSARLHGFDYILQMLAAGREVRGQDITAMGVGGLLKEIPSRPMPRKLKEYSPRPSENKCAAIILAAGRSQRMGKRNKMLEKINGKPMIRHVTNTVVETGIKPIIVVTGHQPSLLMSALQGLEVDFVHNSNFRDGMSTSLKAGITALPEDIEGSFVVLGDMPGIKKEHFSKLSDAFDQQLICVPTYRGKRGNPVLWHQSLFSDILNLSGDIGAKTIIEKNSDYVIDVEMNDEAVLVDLDTSRALEIFNKNFNK